MLTNHSGDGDKGKARRTTTRQPSLLPRSKRAEQRARYKAKHPEKVRAEKRAYLDRKFRNDPERMKKLEGKIRSEFGKLTRLMYDEVLPKSCENCGATEDLHIHHKRYVYPIEREDIVRLCRRCHVEWHQRIPSPDDGVRSTFPVEQVKDK